MRLRGTGLGAALIATGAITSVTIVAQIFPGHPSAAAAPLDSARGALSESRRAKNTKFTKTSGLR